MSSLHSYLSIVLSFFSFRGFFSYFTPGVPIPPPPSIMVTRFPSCKNSCSTRTILSQNEVRFFSPSILSMTFSVSQSVTYSLAILRWASYRQNHPPSRRGVETETVRMFYYTEDVSVGQMVFFKYKTIFYFSIFYHSFHKKQWGANIFPHNFSHGFCSFPSFLSEF